MNERDAFLQALAENEGDDLTRLVFADWLDDHGEHEEADRQRKFPEAKRWLEEVCKEVNVGRRDDLRFSLDELLDFGRTVSATADVNIELSGDIPGGGHFPSAIQDRIPEFWRAWAVVTGLPLQPDVERKCYYISGYCCATEIYSDTHVAGPKSEEFIEREERGAREAEMEEEGLRLLAEQEEQELRRLQALKDEASEALRQQDLERIQDELEQDRP